MDLKTMIPAMREALIAISQDEVWAPDRVHWSIDADRGLMIMAAASEKLNLIVQKSLRIDQRAPSVGRSAIQGELVANRLSDGVLQARMDAEDITLLRTAACSAVATNYCVRADAKVLAVFGTGPQARAQIAAMRAIRPIQRVWLFGRDVTRTESIARQLSEQEEVPVVASDNYKVLRDCDIISTPTNALRPLFASADLGKRVHVNAISAFTPEMIELPAELAPGRSSERLHNCGRLAS